jgi:DNA primase
MNAAEIARHVKGRRVGRGWQGLCPAHNDRNPSLSLTDVDQKVLVHCHAGCKQENVIEALENLGAWQAQPSHRRLLETYQYTDPGGSLLYQILRYEPKTFLQRYANGAGGWIWRKSPNQVLYRLPEVLEAPIVFVVEGERDVETMRSHGFVATTNAGGATAPWLPQFTETLCDREVIIIPDNDEPGWNRATSIARALIGCSSRIRFLRLPSNYKDITDWFCAGHSECEFISRLEAEDGN